MDTESSGSRKSKAMAGAYSSTYSKLQAQGQLLHPSMQLAMAEAGVSASQDLMMSGTVSAYGSLILFRQINDFLVAVREDGSLVAVQGYGSLVAVQGCEAMLCS